MLEEIPGAGIAVPTAPIYDGSAIPYQEHLDEAL
jgi:hypothetical protein